MELGEFLRSEREKKNISLLQISNEIKVRITMLEALEKNKLELLPAPLFVKGYVISYCKCLDIDPEPVLKEFNSYFNKQEKSEPFRFTNAKSYTYEKSQRDRKFSFTIFFFLIILSAAGIYFIFGNFLFHSSNNLNDNVYSYFRNLMKSKSANVSPKFTPTFSVSASDNHKFALIFTPTPIAIHPTETPQLTSDFQTNKKSSKLPANANLSLNAFTALKSVEPQRKPKTEDPFFKGDTLQAEQIHYKLVLKAIQDAWIRYKIDDKPVQKIKLIAGRMIVIRAQNWIGFQLNLPKNLLFRLDLQRNFKNLTNNKQFITINSTYSGSHPFSEKQKLNKFFGKLKPLPVE